MTSVGLGADPVGVRADAGVRRAGGSALLAPLRGLTRLHGFPYAVASAAAAAVAVATAWQPRPAVWLAVITVVGILAVELVTSPPYERGRTLRPVRWLLVTSGAALLGATAAGWWGPNDVRWAGAVVLAAAVVMAGTVVASRIGAPARTVLLVGDRAGVDQLMEQWAACRDVDVMGVCLADVVDKAAHEVGLVPVLGLLDDVGPVAQRLGVDQVVMVPGPSLGGPQMRRLSWALEKLPVELSVVTDMDGVVPRRTTPRVTGRRLTLTVRPAGLAVPARCVKDVVDRVAATILLVVLSPALLTVAILIRLDSPGPAVFRQTRVGRDGKPFTIFKFRTMLADAEARLDALKALDEGAGPLFKLSRVPRTPKIGRNLRRTSLDELPQLVNVVKGEMSLIGPRPGLPTEAMTYDDWVGRRLCVKPGMTGAWQVGGRSNLSWTDSVRLDIDYVDNATLREDLRIAVKTAQVVISRDGAV